MTAQNSWSRYAREYSPLQAGSIDGTDTVPHDRGVFRAMFSKYKPNMQVEGVPRRTLFVSRLAPETDADAVRKCFQRHGKVANVRLVRDLITGASRRYAFVEYESSADANHAVKRLNSTVLDGREILVDFECERTLPGWIPRRLGGGFGGKKESGQLRFGGVDRPFRKPISFNERRFGSGFSGHRDRNASRGDDDRKTGNEHRDRHRRHDDRSGGERLNRFERSRDGGNRFESDTSAGRDRERDRR